ncbi:MAG: sigma-70 family RNA polymerase sigma factor [Deltaproteobacteria bacterium]|nr:sigma-70 family RNA polymerase sigma factor [Deltaproteobacteria bacterium]
MHREQANQPTVMAEDDRLVEAVLLGNVEAFGGIVRKYENAIFNLMYRATGSREEAADLTQDAFLKAYDRLHTFRAGRKFHPWLYTLSINVARDYLRKQKRQPKTSLRHPETIAETASGDSNAVAEADRAAEIQSLFEVLRNLSLDDREALLLRFREGLKMKEIAEQLGLSVSGAKMRVQRGLHKLQEAWKDTDHARKP